MHDELMRLLIQEAKENDGSYALATRAYNVCVRHGITSTKKLETVTFEYVRQFRNCGDKTAEFIEMVADKVRAGENAYTVECPFCRHREIYKGANGSIFGQCDCGASFEFSLKQ